MDEIIAFLKDPLQPRIFTSKTRELIDKALVASDELCQSWFLLSPQLTKFFPEIPTPASLQGPPRTFAPAEALAVESQSPASSSGILTLASLSEMLPPPSKEKKAEPRSQKAKKREEPELVEEKEKEKEKEKEEALVPLAFPSTENLQRITADCEDYGKARLLLTKDHQIRQNILAMLNEIVQTVYPDTTIHLFGSSISGFGAVGGDLDLCLIPGPRSKDLNLRKVDGLFRKHEEVDYVWFKNTLHIPRAAVPIFKFDVHFFTFGTFSCDLSIQNSLVRQLCKIVLEMVNNPLGPVGTS